MTDFVAPFFVGLSQVAIGHPFDTAKILIQNKQNGMVILLKDIIKDGDFL